MRRGGSKKKTRGTFAASTTDGTVCSGLGEVGEVGVDGEVVVVVRVGHGVVVGGRGGGGGERPGQGVVWVVWIRTEAVERRGWVGEGAGLIVGRDKLEVEVVKRRQIRRRRRLSLDLGAEHLAHCPLQPALSVIVLSWLVSPPEPPDLPSIADPKLNFHPAVRPAFADLTHNLRQLPIPSSQHLHLTAPPGNPPTVAVRSYPH